MGFVEILILFFGALGVVGGSGCVSETAKCSQFWVKIEPHKGLIETEQELNSWCRKQSAFYDCLEKVLLAGKDGDVSYLPTNLLVSKLYAEDLCSDGSASRRRYLNKAACINRLNTEFCTLPEYLAIVTADVPVPPSRCSLAEKRFSCIAAAMTMTCGFDAGKVYRNMLKITRYSDEVCDIEASEGIPHCDEMDAKDANSNRAEKLSEIYYGLVDRIGNIPGQVDGVEMPGNSEVNESEETEYEVITEKIKTALDSLDENGVPLKYKRQYTVINYETIGSSLYTPDVAKKTDIKPYKKFPIITQVYRDILFYNYSGHEYALYWRQPDFTIIENISCEHLQPSYLKVVFRCEGKFRTKDPDCVSNGTVHEPVTPELIRDIDPDVPYDSTVQFGPRPEWMKAMDEGKEAKRLRDLMSSTTEFPEYASISGNPEVSTVSTLLHAAETITRAKVQEGSSERFWEYDGPRNSIIPKDIQDELVSILLPDPEKYVPVPMITFRAGESMYTYIFDPYPSFVENITCSRLVECHPRGRGVFRCQVFPRKIETCDVCGRGGPDADIVIDDTRSSIPEDQYATPAYSDADTEASSEENFRSSDEVITLLFSGDENSETDDLESSERNVSYTESNYMNDLVSGTEDSSENLIALILGEGLASTDEARSDHVDGFLNDMQETSHLDSPMVDIVVLKKESTSQYDDPSIRVSEPLYSVDDVRRFGDEARSVHADGFLNDMQKESHLEFPAVEIVVLEQESKSQYEDSSNRVPEPLYSVDDVKRLGDEARSVHVDGFLNDMPEETSHLDFPVVEIVVLEQESKSQYEDSSNRVPEPLYSVDDVKRLGDEARSVHVDGFLNDMPDETSHLDFVEIVVLEQESKSPYEESSNRVPELLYSVKDVKRLGGGPISEFTLSADNYGFFNDNVLLLQDSPDNSIEDEYTFVDISDD